VSALPLVLVVAVAENGVIGRRGALPWRLPGDMKHFKAITMGKPVVMGRRTFESIGGQLKGRANIVLSRDPFFRAEGIRTAAELDSALAIAEEEARRLGASEVAVIGGEALFAATLPRAARMEITEVHAAIAGDTHFPRFDRNDWREIARDGPHQGTGDAYSYSFVTLVRR
jgi:dihydrofolate reductase